MARTLKFTHTVKELQGFSAGLIQLSQGGCLPEGSLLTRCCLMALQLPTHRCIILIFSKFRICRLINYGSEGQEIIIQPCTVNKQKKAIDCISFSNLYLWKRSDWAFCLLTELSKRLFLLKNSCLGFLKSEERLKYHLRLVCPVGLQVGGPEVSTSVISLPCLSGG